jgi:uncharacterized protein YdhG (YjbR/CyaY superfamily)
MGHPRSKQSNGELFSEQGRWRNFSAASSRQLAGPIRDQYEAMKKVTRNSPRRTAGQSKRNETKGHDDYLAALGDDKRRALQKLRKDIKAAAPKAEECISYGIPGFRLDGKLLVSYGAAAKHCAFYPGSTLQAFKDELKDYDTCGKGTIRFAADKPLPSAHVGKIVKARVAEQKLG